MPDLHPTQCPCQDCRSRRLIRDDDVAASRYSSDELEDFGYLLKGKPVGREYHRPRGTEPSTPWALPQPPGKVAVK
jgi:hypothetical protein